jgi:hypothetical protein
MFAWLEVHIKNIDECDLRMQMYWFVAIDALGDVAEIGPSSG